MRLIQTREHLARDCHQYLNSSNASWLALFFLHLFIQICFEQYVPGLVLGNRDTMHKTDKIPFSWSFQFSFKRNRIFLQGKKQAKRMGTRVTDSKTKTKKFQIQSCSVVRGYYMLVLRRITEVVLNMKIYGPYIQRLTVGLER